MAKQYVLMVLLSLLSLTKVSVLIPEKDAMISHLSSQLEQKSMEIISLTSETEELKKSLLAEKNARGLCPQI